MDGGARFAEINLFYFFVGQRKTPQLGLITSKRMSEHLEKSYVSVCTKLLSKKALCIKLKVSIVPASDTSKLNACFPTPCLSLTLPFSSCNYCLVRTPQQYIIAEQLTVCMSCSPLPCAISKCRLVLFQEKSACNASQELVENSM